MSSVSDKYDSVNEITPGYGKMPMKLLGSWLIAQAIWKSQEISWGLESDHPGTL